MNPRATKNGPAAAENKGSVGFGLIVRAIRRHPIVTFLFVLLAGGAWAAIWFYLPLPKMTAYSIFHIQAQSNAIIKPEGDEKIDFKVYQQTQSAHVKSRLVLNATLSNPDVANLPIWKRECTRNDIDPLIWLDNQLKVDFKLGPELMRVSLEGDNADELKGIIDALTAAYLKDNLNKDMAKRRARFATLEKHYRKYEETLMAQRKRYKNLAETLSATTDLGKVERDKIIQQELGAIRNEIGQLQREELRARSDIKLQKERIDKAAEFVVPAEMLEQVLRLDPNYQQLQQKKAGIAPRIAELEKILKPGVPNKLLDELKAELVKIDTEIAEYTNKQKPSIEKRIRDDAILREKQQLALLEKQADSTRYFREELEKHRKQFDGDLKGEKGNQADLEAVKSEIATTEKMAERILGEMESMRPELETAGRVSSWQEPYVAAGIEGRRRLGYSLMAAFGVLLIGLGVVTALEYRNRRVVHADEVTSGLGLRVIGTVPALPRRALARGASMPDAQSDWQQHLAESVDNTRTLLLYGLDGSQSVRTILVTSALSGEGKTSLAGHLAVSLARAGFRTVLVDADMRRPSLHRVLGVPLGSGLSELLRGEVALDQVIQPTPAPGLSIIPAGHWHPRLPQILAGNGWRDIKTSLEAEFDYVIVDSPPLLPVADSLLLARHVDGVLLSLLHDVSRMGAVAEAKDRLAMVGTNVLGVVINGVNNEYYGPTYGYCRVPTPPVGTTTTA
jgi:polysaccharide biosynthesis transport protein